MSKALWTIFATGLIVAALVVLNTAAALAPSTDESYHVARDGKDFYDQTPATRDMFSAAYGTTAPQAWVHEHDGQIAPPPLDHDAVLGWALVVAALSGLVLLWQYLYWRWLPAADKKRILAERAERDRLRAERERAQDERKAARKAAADAAHAQYLERKRQRAIRLRLHLPAFTQCPRCASTWINPPGGGIGFGDAVGMGALSAATGIGWIIDMRNAGVWICDYCHFRWVEAKG